MQILVRIPVQKPDGKDGSAVPDRILQFFKKRKMCRPFGIACLMRPVKTRGVGLKDKAFILTRRVAVA